MGVRLTPGCVGSQAGSMLFSLECEESPLATAASQEVLRSQLQLLEQSVAPLLRPASSFHRRLLRDVLLFRDILLAEEDEVDGVVLASKLTAAGYRVAVRQALGGGSGVQVFSNLRHSFLLVSPPEGGADYIVEPHFCEQFEISQPTLRYSGLLAMMPSVLVATAAQLTPLVQLLCAEMSLAFEQHGLSLPPWRQSKSLLSKWLPSKARDLDLSPYASPRAASPNPPLPLAAFSAAVDPPTRSGGQDTWATSEAASGSVTPGGFSSDDASPRAVLRGASAALLSAQAAAQRGGGSGSSGAPQLVRKSLLSSSLAASGRARSSSPEPLMRSESAGPLMRLPPPAVPLPPSRPAVAHAVASPARAAQQLQLVGNAPVVLHHGASGLEYRVSADWLQPAIRTVKMQGAAAVK